MTDGPLTKKFRIWNPAISELSENQEDRTSQTQDEESSEEKPLDCTSKTSPLQIPEIFQNYLQLAPLMMRLQQQRQMQEELARRQFLSNLGHVVPPSLPSSQSVVTSSPVVVNSTSIVPLPPTGNFPQTNSLGTVPITNPIVATALGSQLVNENCCAVCGAVFRLTGDLVQHMRNNHRKSKFKRKVDIRS